MKVLPVELEFLKIVPVQPAPNHYGWGDAPGIKQNAKSGANPTIVSYNACPATVMKKV
jgi:hypothetical protein